MSSLSLPTKSCCDSVGFQPHAGDHYCVGICRCVLGDASWVETEMADSDGIVRFKDHGPINRETLHGVTAERGY